MTDWSEEMDREEAIERIMEDLRVSRLEAGFVLSILLGESEGDAVLEVQD